MSLDTWLTVRLGGIYYHDHLESLGERATWVEGVVVTTSETSASTKVSEEGEITGREEYVVLERVGTRP